MEAQFLLAHQVSNHTTGGAFVGGGSQTRALSSQGRGAVSRGQRSLHSRTASKRDIRSIGLLGALELLGLFELLGERSSCSRNKEWANDHSNEADWNRETVRRRLVCVAYPHQDTTPRPVFSPSESCRSDSIVGIVYGYLFCPHQDTITQPVLSPSEYCRSDSIACLVVLTAH